MDTKQRGRKQWHARSRDTKLETRSARSRLEPGGKPYYRSLEPGLHLGYRKPSSGGAGKWVTRHYCGQEEYVVANLAIADDFSDPDGTTILNYGQAVAEARKRRINHAKGVALDSRSALRSVHRRAGDE